MVRIATIKYRFSDKLEASDARDLDLRWRDTVVGEVDRGQDLGVVMVEPHETDAPPKALRRIVRKATAEDLSRDDQNRSREREAYRYCKGLILERGLFMKLIDVLYCFDGSKILFTFTADERVDFRDLVRELVQKYHARVEMRQIGVRDEARRLGGLGSCGRELCCSGFLSEFAPVTVKMAKEQSLVFNPQKASGFCGRLKCCLAYEHDRYARHKKEKAAGA